MSSKQRPQTVLHSAETSLNKVDAEILTINEIDAKLIANGYEPVACAGKRPVADAWTTRPNTIEALEAERVVNPYAINTGLRTGTLVGVDIDIVNPDHVAQIKALAFETLGTTILERIGAKGMMLGYRNSDPIRKITIAGQGGKVEILGVGQQFVAFGPHPDTGIPYRWACICKKDGVLSPLNVPFNLVSSVTPDMLHLFRHRTEKLMKELGYSGAKATGGSGNDKREKPASPKKGKPVSASHLREILGYIDPPSDRTPWRDIVAAIRNTPLVDDDEEREARAIAREWSEGELDRKGGYKDNLPEGYTCKADIEQVFNTMPPRADGVGYGSIFHAAKEAGYKGPPARPSANEIFAGFVNANGEAETKTENKPAAKTTNIFLTCDDRKNLPTPEYVIDTILQDKTDGLLYGKPGSCKSFVAVDLACSIAAAAQYPDMNIKALGLYTILTSGSVFYFAAEGFYAICKKRILAWELAHGLPPNSLKNLLIASVPPLLSGQNIDPIIKSADAHIQQLQMPPVLWIIDTQNRAIAGADENAASTAALYFDMTAALRTLGGATLTIGHCGKDEERGARGSSAFHAGFDTVFYTTKSKNEHAGGNSTITIETIKQKDAEEAQPFFLKTQKILLPDNSQSLILEPLSADDAKRAAGKQVGLRRTDVGAALKALGACPGGANEWNGKTGGIDTKNLAREIARIRAETAGTGRALMEKEISTLVTELNRGARNGGPFEAYVVSEKRGRQWAIAPSAVGEGQGIADV